MQVHKLGRVTQTLNIEQVTKGTNKESQVYMLQPRASLPVQLAVLMEPGNVLSKLIPYSLGPEAQDTAAEEEESELLPAAVDDVD